MLFRETGDVFYATKWMIFSAVFLFLALFLFFLIRPKEFFSDFDISKREKRGMFYTIAAVSAMLYFFTAVFFKGVFFPLSIVALGIVLSCVVMEICNMYIKVSVHTAVTAAFLTTVGILYGIGVFLMLCWILPVVIWSRLTLKKHMPKEILWGLIIGESVTAFTFVIARVLQ